jgi:hypothetical protein
MRDSHVNVIVAPQGGGAGARPPRRPGAAGSAGQGRRRPPRLPIGPGPMAGRRPCPGPPGLSVAPGGIPPGLVKPRMHGGRTGPTSVLTNQIIKSCTARQRVLVPPWPAAIGRQS